jgi:hypothetical protein
LATGGGGGGAENNFPKKNFQVKFEKLVLSGRFNQTPPPLKRVSRDGTDSQIQLLEKYKESFDVSSSLDFLGACIPIHPKLYNCNRFTMRYIGQV